MNSTLLEGRFFKNPILYEGNIENGRITKVNGDVSGCRSFRPSSWGCAATADVVFSHNESARHSEVSISPFKILTDPSFVVGFFFPVNSLFPVF